MFPSIEIERERIESIVALWYRIPHRRSYAILFADLPDGFCTLHTPAAYDADKVSGICVTIGCDNRTTGGKVQCQDCRDSAKSKRKQRNAAGMCQCGSKAQPGYRSCFDCRQKAALARRKRR